MDTQAKIAYNVRSAAKHGWSSSWFGCDNFDEELLEKITQFQSDHDLEADGLCGPMTYARILTEREANEDTNYIICNGENVWIDWDKTVNMYHRNGKEIPPECYSSTSGVRTPTMIVTHWDAALSADSCYRILKKRGISSHFVIDNDGTIYQMVDTQHKGWHAGNRAVNACSVGIDFSNAYYTKYQNWYVRRGFGERPIIEDAPMHGRTLEPFLGYYPVQIEAYKALLKGLNDHYGIKLECPLDEDGELLSTVDDTAAAGDFEGVVAHYHLTRRKKDTAGLELDKILEDIRNHNDGCV